jgi:hypothetical protein
MANGRDSLPFSNHRNEIERQIIVLLVEDILTAGYAITVNNGEEDVLVRSANAEQIFEAMSTTDEEYLGLHWSIDTYAHSTAAEWIKLVYGNSGYVISDYSVGVPSRIFGRADALAARFQACNR